MMSLAQVAVSRVLNSLPEGILIALGAWLLLRLMRGQNSGTRFAVWMVALAGVMAVPVLSGFGATRRDLAAIFPHAHPEFAIPAFWAAAFFFLWIAISFLALARVIAGIWRISQIRRGCTEIRSTELHPSLRQLLEETRRPVRVLSSEGVRIPAALGFRNPAIVLPAWTLRDLSPEDLRPIVLHELAHLRRHDDWTNLLQKTVRAVFFFHPAVWWIDARLSMEREMACDDAVLTATGNARAYAGCLIDLLERDCSRRKWTMAQAAVARARDASVRIARILRVGSAATTRLSHGALAVAASLSVACAGIAVCAPQLVEFVPIDSDPGARVSVPSVAEALHAPASAMIPAAFHPDRSEARNLVPLRGATLHTIAHRPSSLSLTPAATVRPEAHPYGMAKLAEPPADPPKPQPAAARFIAASERGADQEPVPLIVIFETRESATIPTSAELRTVTAEPNVTRTSKVQQLQSREDPALQLEMYQAIDPATGTPIQILHIVFTVPQLPGMPSQSI